MARRLKNPFLRKGRAYVYRILKSLIKIKFQWQNVESGIVFINSFPKSGTHLIAQIFDGMARHKDYGQFIASMPTIRFCELSTERVLSRIRGLIPGELALGHLFHHSVFEKAFEEQKVRVYFIYRDLRDVAVSEAFYLSGKNPFHALHPYFKRLKNTKEKILFSILGNEYLQTKYDYPDIGKRWQRYNGWLKADDCCCVRYEDLTGCNRRSEITRLAEHLKAGVENTMLIDRLVESGIQGINPEFSHTFRAGRAGNWRKYFDNEITSKFKRVAGKVLIELGYEKDFDW